MNAPVTVTQADRDLAAKIMELQERQGMADLIRLGSRDSSNTVQLLARHRLATEAAFRAERRNLVSHATGGNHTGEDMSLNDVCVAISAFRNTIYAAGKESAEAAFRAREDALAEALAQIAYEAPDDPAFVAHAALRNTAAPLARAKAPTDVGGTQ
jgi:hypothetical protein